MSADLSSARSRGPLVERPRGHLWLAGAALLAMLGGCDPHAESAGADNSTESGTTGSATDEGPVPDATGRETGDPPSQSSAPAEGQPNPDP